MTNFDRLKEMGTAEAAGVLCDMMTECSFCPLKEICASGDDVRCGWRVWLEMEVDESE